MADGQVQNMMQGLKSDEEQRLVPKNKLKNLKSAKSRSSQRAQSRKARESDLYDDLESQPEDRNAQQEQSQGRFNRYWTLFSQRMLWFQIYFVVQVIFGVIMICYYLMLAAKPRDACTVTTVSKTTTMQENISGSLTASFVAGFALHLINFTVNTFVEPCIRLITLSHVANREAGQPKYSNWFMVGFGADAIFRLSFLIFSIGQLILLGSDGMASCSKDKPALGYDANWLRSLATVQILFIPAFYAWRYFAVLDEKVEAPRASAAAVPQQSPEEQALLHQLKREAHEVSKLRQQCLEVRQRLSQKERALEDAAIAGRSMTDLNAKSTDRTDVLVGKRDRLRNMEGEAERKIRRRRKRQSGRQEKEEMLEGLNSPSKMYDGMDTAGEPMQVPEMAQFDRPQVVQQQYSVSERRSIPYKEEVAGDKEAGKIPSVELDLIDVSENRAPLSASKDAADKESLNSDPMFAYKNDLVVNFADRPMTSATNRDAVLKSAQYGRGAFKQQKMAAADVTSVGPSQYQSIYPVGELRNKGMAMHDLLASEYDMGNVAVTKMRPHQQRNEGNIDHERMSSPDERGQTYLASGEKKLFEESPSFDGR